MKTLKNVFRVAVSNIASFGTSFIIGFILPSILTVADYGYYKEYILYLSFAYIFNLGFNDGIYIKYGGKKRNELDQHKMNEEHNFVLVFQLAVLTLMVIFSVVLQNIVLTLFSIATFFVSMNTYHQNFMQAIGEFKLFSMANIFKSVFYVGLLLISTLILRADQYVFYILLNIFSLVFVFVFYEYHMLKSYSFSRDWNIKGKIEIFRIGIFILIANMSLTFVGNVGSWVVKFGNPIETFAQYSFQNSVLNVILLIINAVGMVFYNVISQHSDKSILKVIKEVSLLLGVVSGLAFFIFSAVIRYFLPAYIPAISLLSITFIAIPYIMISKILIANLYKTNRNEKKYFKDSVLFAVSSFLIVGSVFLITNNIQYIAVSTTLSYIFWFMYTTRIEFNYLKGGYKENLLLFSHIIFFFYASNYLTVVSGFVFYAIYLIVVLILYRTRLKEIIKNYL